MMTAENKVFFKNLFLRGVKFRCVYRIKTNEQFIEEVNLQNEFMGIDEEFKLPKTPFFWDEEFQTFGIYTIVVPTINGLVKVFELYENTQLKEGWIRLPKEKDYMGAGMVCTMRELYGLVKY